MSPNGQFEESRPSSEACAAFADYLACTVRGERVDFEAFRRDRQDLAAELKSLHAEWVSSPSFRDWFLRRHGQGLGSTIARNPGRPGGRPQELEPRAAPADRYSVRGEVARGGMGAVLKVWDADLRRILAMKVVLGNVGSQSSRDEHETNPEVLSRFLEEAQITSQLDHPGVVPVHELGINIEGRAYFTMRLVEGRDFKEIVDLVREHREGWTRTRALGVIQKVCEAMAYAHSKKVIHRDLKPANVMVGRFGEVYVMDWGLAKVLGRKDTRDLRLRGVPHPTPTSVRTDRRDKAESDPDSPLMTMDGAVVGTPSYMAPEQAEGRVEDLGPRSDVYAVGAMLYTLLAGRMPYVTPGARMSPYTVLWRVLEGPPTPVHKIDGTVPVELTSICEKAMARDPADRYADMLEMADDLRAYLEDRVVRAHETGAVAELKKWVLRNRSLAAVSVSALLALFGGSLWYSARLREALGVAERRTAEAEQARTEADAALERARVQAEVAKQRTAEKNRAMRRARALELASASVTVAAQDPMCALLLAREAAGTCPLPEVIATLHSAIHRVRRGEGSIRGHTASVLSAVFSPVGDRILTASDDKTARLWDLEGKVLAVFEGHKSTVYSAVFSPSGDRILTASSDKTARLWDSEGREIAVFEGHSSLVRSPVFSPSGDQVLTASADGTARRWSLEGQELAVLRGHTSGVWSAAFSPAGDRIVTASADGTARLWDLAGRTLAVFPEHRLQVLSAVFSPSGDRILTASADKTARLWNLEGKVLAVCWGHESTVYSAVFSPSGDRILTASADGTARLWDLEGKELAILRGHEGGVTSARFSRSGDRVITASDSAAYSSPGELARTVSDPDALSAASNGIRINTAADRTARLWDLEGKELAILRGHERGVTSASFSPSGRRILTSSWDKTARVWLADPKDLLELAGRLITRDFTAEERLRYADLLGDKTSESR